MDSSLLLDYLLQGGDYVGRAVGSPAEMAVRLTIEGGFVYLGWRLFKLSARLRWSPRKLIRGSYMRRTYLTAGARPLLVNLFVILPLDVVKAIVYTLPAGFYLKPIVRKDDAEHEAQHNWD